MTGKYVFFIQQTCTEYMPSTVINKTVPAFKELKSCGVEIQQLVLTIQSDKNYSNAKLLMRMHRKHI